MKPRAKSKKRASKDISAENQPTDNQTDTAAQDGDSLSNETPEPGSDQPNNNFGLNDSNGFGAFTNNDDDSFESDSDDGLTSALKQVKIKEKDDNTGGRYGTVEDISQIMSTVTLNPVGNIETKTKRTMKKSVSMGLVIFILLDIFIHIYALAADLIIIFS